MPIRKVNNLMISLHDMFGDDSVSPEQNRLMEEINQQMEGWDTPDERPENLLETVEILLAQIEEKHPKGAAVAKEIVKILRDIGV